MPTHHKLIAFDRPLSGATIPGRLAKLFDESQVEAIRVEAYRQGGDAAQAFANQQIVELRTAVQELQDGVFAKLGAADQAIVGQVQAALPGLIVEIARRLLAGYEPTAETVEKLCRETLEQLYPERENLELLVSPRDAALLEQLSPTWKARFPGLRIMPDAGLSPGDCQVRSRFGITDARLTAKFETLSRELLTS